MTRLIPIILALLVLGCGKPETDSTIIDADVAVDVPVLSDGDFTETYDNGVLKVKGTILGGDRFGTWISYHQNGNKASENEYRNGRLNGKSVVFYESGQVRYIGYYLNAKKSGVWQFWSFLGF